ncbi:hypothetical protein BDD12DRAFT_15705 [Trichophaea hybrida]|nr:hypothetical protein BDD12DRAFT_15705 [Trichophaea hybrida]
MIGTGTALPTTSLHPKLLSSNLSLRMPSSVSNDTIPETSVFCGRNNWRGKRSSKKRPRARRTASDKTISVTDAADRESSIDQRPQTNLPTITASNHPSRYGIPSDSSRNTVLRVTAAGTKSAKKSSTSSSQTNNVSIPLASPPQATQYSSTITLVKGEYVKHIPGNLHEPLGSGFQTWAHSQKTPQTARTARWHNRILEFWRLATDAARFDRSREEDVLKAPPLPHPLTEFAPLPQRPYPQQRPYTAPAHQSEE